MQIGSKEGVLVSGTATKDAEYKLIGEKKTPLAAFSLAINSKGADGKYVNCKAFGEELADYAKNIKKGNRVAASGFVESREYNGKTYNDLNCDWLNIVGRSTAQKAQTAEPEETIDFSEMEDDEELPF